MYPEKRPAVEHRNLTTAEIEAVAERLNLPVAVKGEEYDGQIVINSSDTNIPIKHIALHKTARLIANELRVQRANIEFAVSSGVCSLRNISVSGAEISRVREEDVEFGPDESFQLIVPAGGLGTRLRPITLEVPKSLLPVGGIPLLTRINDLFRGENITSRSVIVNYDGNRPSNYPDAFTSWWKANTDVSLVDEQDEEPGIRSVLETMMLDDGRYALVVHGDKFIDFDQNKIEWLLERIKQEMADCSFMLVGKKSALAGRRVGLEGDELQAIGRGTDFAAEDGVGFGSAFFVFDTEKLPVDLSQSYLGNLKFTDFFQLLLQEGIRGKIFELPEEFLWKNVNSVKDYHALLEMQADTLRLQDFPDALAVLEAHSHLPNPGCVFPEQEELVGGRSGSEVIRVSGSNGKDLVRKSYNNAIPVDEIGATEHQAALIDQQLFPGPAFVEDSEVCNICPAKVCMLGEFVEGHMLDEFIQNDLPKAHQIRLKVVDIMENKGYFKQSHERPGHELWLQWFANRFDMFHELAGYQQEQSQELYSGDIDLGRVVQTAVDILSDETINVPHGFYPRDLNPANIIVSPRGEIRVIDQTMLFGDPAIVALKLIIGWRRLSNPGQPSLAESVRIFVQEREEIKSLDEEMLRRIQACFPGYQELRRRFYAALAVRHVRGLLHMRRRYAGDEGLDGAESIIREYISEALAEMNASQN